MIKQVMLPKLPVITLKTFLLIKKMDKENNNKIKNDNDKNDNNNNNNKKIIKNLNYMIFQIVK
jgi:hypothetical protein